MLMMLARRVFLLWSGVAVGPQLFQAYVPRPQHGQTSRNPALQAKYFWTLRRALRLRPPDCPCNGGCSASTKTETFRDFPSPVFSSDSNVWSSFSVCYEPLRTEGMCLGTLLRRFPFPVPLGNLIQEQFGMSAHPQWNDAAKAWLLGQMPHHV